MTPAAVIELNEDLSSTQLEKMRHGTLDTIEGRPAIVRSNNTYIVKLAPKTVGAMTPANRQAVVRWSASCAVVPAATLGVPAKGGRLFR